MLAFEIFGLRPPPDPSKIPSSLEKLRVTFKLREPMEELVEQFHDFQKYAIHMDKQHGALDSFECWKQSILKVGASIGGQAWSAAWADVISHSCIISIDESCVMGSMSDLGMM